MADGGYIREYLVGLGFEVDERGLDAFRAALENAKTAAQGLEKIEIPALSAQGARESGGAFAAALRMLMAQSARDAAAAFNGFPARIGAIFAQAAANASASFAPAVAAIAAQAQQILAAVQGAAAAAGQIGSAAAGNGKTTVLQNEDGGVYDRPALTTIAEGGAREYVIPVEKPQRAAPLLRAAMNELGAAAPHALPTYAAQSRQDAQGAPVTTNNTTNRVEAPITLQVYGSDAAATAGAVSRTLERRLAHNLRGRVRV